MSILQKIRLGSAIVLLCAIFLPLSECSRHNGEHLTPATKSMSQRILPQDNADFVYQYATNVMRPSTWQGGGVALVALTWPLAFFLVERRRRSQRFTWIFYVVELLLCAGTLYWLHLFTALGQWLYGAYLVCAAIAIYALASLVLFIGHIRKRPIE